MIDSYREGSDITIMNAYYQYSLKDEETGKRKDDFMIIVYKDNKTGETKHQTIKKPEYTYYKANDGIVLDHNLFFIEKENVHPISVPFSQLEKSIAKETGNIDFYNENIASGNRRENQKLHTIMSIFNSDMTVEDYYRAKFSRLYTNNITRLNKSFFDIEVDTRYCAGDFVELGECPINAIAFHDERHDIIHQFLLRDPKNPLIEKFENDIKCGRFGYNEIRKFVTKAIGGEKQLIRYKLDKTKFDIKFFDNEIDLVKAFFMTVHKYKPDFCEGWNSSAFDLSYIIERIKVLGYSPEDIMCDPEWSEKIVKNYVDNRNLSMLPERGDYTFISGNTTWIDQMIQFASRRKNKYGSFTSFKLDDIGQLTAKVKKLNYSHITNNLAMLPYLDYVTFALYNIFDVIVQKCIELKSQDLEYLFANALVNNTAYKKVHRQSVYLTNRMTKEFEKMGYIIGNNVNRWNEKPDKFVGALVGDPTHTNSYAKMTINGVPIFICESLLDFDYKSLYPSIINENNIAPNTQIGRIIIDHVVYQGENAFNTEKYTRGGEFIENMVTNNHLEFCHRWLHLANFQEFKEDMQEYYNKTRISYRNDNTQYATYLYNAKDDRVFIAPIKDIGPSKKISPVRFEENKKIKPVFFFNERKVTI